MLDKRSARLLDVILDLCGQDGAYKILEIPEMQNGMLPRFKIDIEVLSQILKFLAAADMIDIKYNDENVYCVAVLPKGRLFEEERQRARDNRVLGRGMAVIIIMGSFFAAIIGAVIGGVLVAYLG